MAGRTGNEKVIEQFLADGFTYMFGNPGTVEQGFLDALREYPDMRYILTLQESVAVMMADGYARATKQPALVQIHSAPGLGNAIGAIYQAKRGHAPLVVIGGDAGLSYLNMEAQMYADLVAMAEPVTKWAAMVYDSRSLLRMVRRAVKIATTPPMGPVYLCLPADVLDQINEEEVYPACRLEPSGSSDEEALQRAADLLCGAKDPTIFIGDGIAYADAQAELTGLAEQLGAPVWGVDAGELNMDTTHPCYRGQTGHMFGEGSNPLTKRGDVVLICGTYMMPEVYPALGDIYQKDAAVIHIDWDSDAIAKNHRVDIGILGHPKATLKRLGQLVKQSASAGQKAVMEARRAGLSPVPVRAAGETAADEFLHRLNGLMPDAVVFDEALTCSPLLNAYFPPTKPGHFFQTRGGSLGVGVTGAMGIKLAFPEKEVIGFAGDGGTMYVIQALWTAAREHIGAKFVIFSNRSYGLLKQNIRKYWETQKISEHEMPIGFSIDGPELDFVEFARAQGIDAMRVTTKEEADEAAKKMAGSKKAFLVELTID